MRKEACERWGEGDQERDKESLQGVPEKGRELCGMGDSKGVETEVG